MLSRAHPRRWLRGVSDPRALRAWSSRSASRSTGSSTSRSRRATSIGSGSPGAARSAAARELAVITAVVIAALARGGVALHRSPAQISILMGVEQIAIHGTAIVVHGDTPSVTDTIGLVIDASLSCVSSRMTTPASRSATRPRARRAENLVAGGRIELPTKGL
jgi:hypothetical protein